MHLSYSSVERLIELPITSKFFFALDIATADFFLFCSFDFHCPFDWQCVVLAVLELSPRGGGGWPPFTFSRQRCAWIFIVYSRSGLVCAVEQSSKMATLCPIDGHYSLFLSLSVSVRILTPNLCDHVKTVTFVQLLRVKVRKNFPKYLGENLQNWLTTSRRGSRPAGWITRRQTGCLVAKKSLKVHLTSRTLWSSLGSWPATGWFNDRLIPVSSDGGSWERRFFFVGRSPPVKLVFLSDPRFGRAKKKIPKVGKSPSSNAGQGCWVGKYLDKVHSIFCLVERRFCFLPSTNAMDVMIVDLQPFSVDRNCVYFRKYLAILEQSTSFAS